MNPAEASARADAERRGTVVGSAEDVTEDYLLAATAGDDECAGAWPLGETPRPPLWGTDEGGV